MEKKKRKRKGTDSHIQSRRQLDDILAQERANQETAFSQSMRVVDTEGAIKGKKRF